jgi:lipoprotein-releasing system ATP-binding protein
MPKESIITSDLTKSFSNTKVLKGINLKVEKGEQYVIKGASGSGKSTLLYLLGGLDRPDSGVISVNGESLNNYSDEQLAQYRNEKIGFVFQFHFLLSSMNCLDNILLPASLSKKYTVESVRPFIMDVADLLGVTDCLEKMPYELSGGQQQRINLIRAVSLKPDYLLCDEPTGSLDSVNTEIVCDFLFKLSQSLKITLLTVTHDRNVASQFPYHCEMKDGVLYQ